MRYRDMRRSVLLIALLVHGAPIVAAEIASNGSGGGPWSDPASWRGKAAPTANDDVVIQKGDVILFDRDDESRTSCGRLFLDPRSALQFETQKGHRTLCVADRIESYGAIRMDGTRSSDDRLELRMVGEAPDKRNIKLLKGAALLVAGRGGLPAGQANVSIRCPRSDKKEAVPGILETTGGVMLDIQKAMVEDCQLRANDLDNTGSRPNERLSIVDNHLIGHSRVFCQKCDSPIVARNLIELLSEKALGGDVRAIHVSECPLADVRGNTVRGPYTFGIAVSHGSDTSIADNRIEGCEHGLHIGFGTNHMLKQNMIRKCAIGLDVRYPGPSVAEDTVIDGCHRALVFVQGSLQATNLEVRDLPADGIGIHYHQRGQLTLINSNLTPGQVKFEALGPPIDKQQTERITSFVFVVAAIGKAPEGAEVVVRSVNPAPPATGDDPRIRNSPATVVDGRTPLPQTLAALTVNSWSMDLQGKAVAVNEYEFQLLAPADKPGAERTVLGRIRRKPSEAWYRPRPNDAAPTPEVALP